MERERERRKKKKKNTNQYEEFHYAGMPEGGLLDRDCLTRRTGSRGPPAGRVYVCVVR